MKKIYLVSLVIVLVSGLIFGGSAIAAPKKPIELRLAYNGSPMSPACAKFLAPWAKKVGEVTNGRVKVTIYPSQTLCKVKEAVVATESGVADLSWVLLGLFPGQFRLTTVLSVPFVHVPTAGKIDGRTLSDAGMNSHILQELYETFPEIQAEWANVKVLVLHTSGPLFLLTRDKPVRNQKDLKGLKIRELAGPNVEMWKLLGAAPVIMPLPAAYEAAEKGVINAASIDWGGTLGYRLYEVFRYKTNIQTAVLSYSLIMNKEKWNSLPPDIREAIMSVSGIYGAELAGMGLSGIGTPNFVRARAKKAGHEMEEVSLDPGELEKWIEIAGKPVWGKWVADMEAKGLPGQKVLDEAFRLIKKYKP